MIRPRRARLSVLHCAVVRPLLWTFSAALDVLEMRRTGAFHLVGSLGRGKPRPAGCECLLWYGGKLLANACRIRHRNEELKAIPWRHMIKKLGRGVLRVRCNQCGTILGHQDLLGHVQYFGCSLGDRTRRCSCSKADRLFGISIKQPKRLAHLRGAVHRFSRMHPHLSCAVTAHPMGIAGQ